MSDKVEKTEAQWQAELSSERFAVTRQGGTERAFTGCFWDHKGDGLYRCGCCGADLFDSRHKYDSGSGWPSFTEAAGASVETREDLSHGMVRTEILCKRCDAHLGHRFPDGPRDAGGLRYCINSAALDFVPRAEVEG